MRPFFRLTVGRKIIGLIAGLLLCSIVSLVGIATHLFVRDNVALIQQMNADTVASRAIEARDTFENVNQKMRLLGSILAQNHVASEIKQTLTKEFFDDNTSFLGVVLYRNNVVHSKAIAPALQKMGDNEGDGVLGSLSAGTDFSFDQLAAGEAQIALRPVTETETAIVLGIPFIKTKGVVTHSLVALLRPAELFKNFAENDLVTTFMVDRKGRLLAHPNAQQVLSQVDFSDQPIVQEMLSGKFNNGQTRYLDPTTEEARLAAFRLVGFAGLGVVAEVPEAKAFEAAKRIEYRAALLGIGILCIAFFCGYFFSDTIIQPILELVQAALKISKGDFNIQLTPRGRDEIAYLSHTFGKMVSGLQERDRVKDLFGKFHNKEIAEKLLKGDVKLGGERMKATVLFTDIRGFTSMSEVMRPEEVVEMLNEYMTKMVTIITAHGGMVDKYVGDAIMAVWGVPQSKGDDTANAVKACLAMRQALAELNTIRIARGQAALMIGMGLNSGEVTAGNIGSVERMEYTVIGDAVNLSARIESLTKEKGTDLLVSGTVRDQVKDKFLFESCDEVQVRGKSIKIEVFNVRGYLNEAGQPVVVATPYSRFTAEKKSSEPAA